MSDLSFDVVVIGSGFAGSLTATILQKHGLSVALLDRSRHPRFAIGESSTPTANLILKDIADKHSLDWLRPLAKFGPWRRAYPQITSGLKRGFSYFQHLPGMPFAPNPDHSNELLVQASANDDVSDTQWLRADVDAFLFRKAQYHDVPTFEETMVHNVQRGSGRWLLESQQRGQCRNLHCDFVIDASGSADAMVRLLKLPTDTECLKTHSRSIFGHFDALSRWEETLNDLSPAATADHPFHCDDAALHHVFEEGWMWWIRFTNGITSVGITLDSKRFPFTPALSADVEWDRVLSRYPTVHHVLAAARRIYPQNGLQKTPRLQRCVPQCVGDGWALLPHTAGFIDPLHSTGIAHSLAGIDRLTSALLNQQRSSRESALRSYQTRLLAELKLIDLFVSGCYEAIAQRSFRKFVAFSMCYFAAATTWERRKVTSDSATCPTLFLADDEQFVAVVKHLQNYLAVDSESDFEVRCQEHLRPFNHVGIFAPAIPNMYGNTAVPLDR